MRGIGDRVTERMRRLRIYLDMSVGNFLFAEDAPDFQRVTAQFLGEPMQALQEVQCWKTGVLEDLKDLPYGEAIRTLAQRAHETAVALGFHAIGTAAHVRRVAETVSAYMSKRE